MEEPSKRRPE